MTDAPVVLISGARRGIGLAIAMRLRREGWRLSLGMRPSTPDAAPGAPDGIAPGEDLLLHPYDALAGGEDAWVAATLARFGRIDAIVANAGVFVGGSVLEGSDAALDTMWAVHVKAPRRLAQAAFPALAATGRGRIVIIASLSGKRVKSAGSSLYAVTKHAAVALTHGLRQSGFDQGIRATAICPGFVATDMARGITPRADDEMTDPADVAALVSLALALPNTASVAELAVNCQAEELY